MQHLITLIALSTTKYCSPTLFFQSKKIKSFKECNVCPPQAYGHGHGCDLKVLLSVGNSVNHSYV